MCTSINLGCLRARLRRGRAVVQGHRSVRSQKCLTERGSSASSDDQKAPPSHRPCRALASIRPTQIVLTSAPISRWKRLSGGGRASESERTVILGPLGLSSGRPLHRLTSPQSPGPLRSSSQRSLHALLGGRCRTQSVPRCDERRATGAGTGLQSRRYPHTVPGGTGGTRRSREHRFSLTMRDGDWTVQAAPSRLRMLPRDILLCDSGSLCEATSGGDSAHPVRWSSKAGCELGLHPTVLVDRRNAG